MSLNTRLQDFIEREARKANTHAVWLAVQSGDGRVNFEGAAGHAAPEAPFFIASITKMFTALVAVQLVDEGRLDLQARLVDLLPDVDLTGLHRVKRQDMTAELRLHQLVDQTSGLADYYEGGFADGLKRNEDRAYGLPEVLDMARALPGSAAPGGDRAYYSDTNFQLLGAVIERACGAPLAEVFAERLFEPLGLTETWIYDDRDGREVPVPIYMGAQALDLRRALSCMAPDGGGVWTLTDGVRFLRAVFGGQVVRPERLAQMMQWRAMFFPLQYGMGMMRFTMPRWMTLFRKMPEMVGHSGASGSFAFHVPERDLYLVGNFGQMDAPQRPFRVMPRILRLVETESS